MLPFLGEEGNLTFRAEAFKVFNNPIFANPQTNISNSNFGQITSTLDTNGQNSSACAETQLSELST